MIAPRQRIFGHLPDGTPVGIHRLDNGAGMSAEVMAWGGTLVSLQVPDRRGEPADVVLGFDALAPYLGEHPYFGTLVGRFANRIAGGRFSLDGREYALARNEGANHLHGGARGFDKRLWDVLPSLDAPQLALSLVSEDGDEGYPGRLEAHVTYTLSEDALRIDYEATADAPTLVNLTHHAYFNLAAEGDVLRHELQLAASRFLPVDAGLIPTGELRPVAGTPFDFRQPRRIGERIAEPDEQLARASGGYDHCWAIDRNYEGLVRAAELADPGTGRRMALWTTEPGLQFYTGNFLDGRLAGKGGRCYGRHAGLCLEAQGFPDSPHHAHFPSAVLRPGEVYRQTTLLRFAAG